MVKPQGGHRLRAGARHNERHRKSRTKNLKRSPPIELHFCLPEQIELGSRTQQKLWISSDFSLIFSYLSTCCIILLAD
jgi:hypothetical protein